MRAGEAKLRASGRGISISVLGLFRGIFIAHPVLRKNLPGWSLAVVRELLLKNTRFYNDFRGQPHKTNEKPTFFADNLIGGWGGESVVKPPTGKSFRFVRACERARRGEAVWASERRFDCEARAVVRAV